MRGLNMASEDQAAFDDEVERRPISWRRREVTKRRPDPTSLYIYVLDEDSDLADEFDIRTRVAARQLATARVLRARRRRARPGAVV